MSRKKEKNSVAIVIEDVARKKWGNVASWIMLGLVLSIPFCLLWSWCFGSPGVKPIEYDNYLTAFIQNYNYILVSVVLVPIIAYIYSRLKEELNKRYLSDSQILGGGFLAFIIVLVAIIVVCNVVNPINSLHNLYKVNGKIVKVGFGVNSVGTVGVFLAFVTVFLIECVVYGVLKINSLLKNKGEFSKVVKRYFPIILMVMFLVWTFISCMIAPSVADDYLGAEAAKEMGASPEEVLSKTLNGCYNLKDGFWAFLSYGTILIGAMLIAKTQNKKMLIRIFCISITLLSIATLYEGSYSSKITNQYTQKALKEYEAIYNQYMNVDSGEYDLGRDLTWDDFKKAAITEGQNEAYKVLSERSSNTFINPQRGIFRNSNHFAYVLCIAVLATAGLVLVEKDIALKSLWLICFVINTIMLIINNTFGGYLGVLIALGCMGIYGIINAFLNKKEDNENSYFRYLSLGIISILIVLFAIISCCIKDENGGIIAKNNLARFGRDIGVFGGYMLNEENPTEVDVSTLDTSITKAGSGRGETWIKVWELIKQKPMFGYGLECLLFQFSGQFDVGEGRTHNLLLQLLATVGIPGTLMYFTALAIIFIRLLKNWKTWDDVEKICVFVGISYMVTALTGNSTYYTSPYFMMFLGFVALTPWNRGEKFAEESSNTQKFKKVNEIITYNK